LVARLFNLEKYGERLTKAVNEKYFSAEEEVNLIRAKMEENEERPLHIEGYASCEWVLMDYNDVNVNIFQEESRMFYSLERLWQECEQIEF